MVDSLEEEAMVVAEISPGEMEGDLPDPQLPHDPCQMIPSSSRRRSSGT